MKHLIALSVTSVLIAAPIMASAAPIQVARDIPQPIKTQINKKKSEIVTPPKIIEQKKKIDAVKQVQEQQTKVNIDTKIEAAIKEPIKDQEVTTKKQFPIINKIAPEKIQTTVQRINTLYDAQESNLVNHTIINDDTKKKIAENITADRAWIIDAQQRIFEASAIKDKIAIRDEIREHVKSRAQERKEIIIQQANLPALPNLATIDNNITAIDTVIEKLENSDIKNRDEIIAAADSLQAALSQLSSLQTELETSRSIEAIQAVRDQLELVQQRNMDMRNLLQTILL